MVKVDESILKPCNQYEYSYFPKILIINQLIYIYKSENEKQYKILFKKTKLDFHGFVVMHCLNNVISYNNLES
jgi:hypothetical protein